jgi:membrane-bound lytic murein transglycosylase D
MRKIFGNIGKSGVGLSLFPLVVFFCLIPSQALGESYQYTDIHPAGWIDTRGICINGGGGAVGFGTTDSGERGFLWSAGRNTEILPPGADSARTVWINDSGEIAGTGMRDGVVCGTGEFRAFVSRDGAEKFPPGFSVVAPGLASERAFFSAFPDMDILASPAPSDSSPFSLWKPPRTVLPAQEPDREETMALRDPEEIPVFSSVLGGVDASVGGATGAVVSSVAGVVIPFAAPPEPPPAGTASFLVVLREEKEPDLVLSQRDVEVLVERNEEAEPVVALDAAFFANAPEEIEKGADGSYAGLTRRIDKFIRYFQTRGRARFEIWLSRSGKYSDMMRGILAKYGMPGDLVYLALIESGFSPNAYSVARAAGPWQFIAGTGRRYGLRVDWWADERRDYEKSTHAAAAYLRDLYGIFDSWPLAAAAYNAGENRIMRAVSRYKTEDFAKLIRYRYLPRETKDYVPKMLAALTIAKDPDRYGFGNVQYEDPLAFDKVVIPGGTDLAVLGSIIGVPAESLKEWNPELKRFCTPPNTETYEIRLPEGFGLIAAERLDEIRSEAKVTFLRHKVRKKETLASLAEQYRTPVSTLKEMNGLRRNSLRRISRLIIPVAGLSEEEAVPGKRVSPDKLRLAHMRVNERYRRGQRVRVRRGDTLWRIARRSGVSVKSLARANRMKTTSILRAGRVIRIPGAVSSSGKGSRHVVRRGDTLWKIARKYGVSVKQLARRNRMRSGQTLRTGRVLQIPTES